MPEWINIALAKLFGAIAGATISNSIHVPKTWADRIAITLSSIICGFVLGGSLMDKAEKSLGITIQNPSERYVAGCLISAIIAWPLILLLVKTINGLKSIRNLKQ